MFEYGHPIHEINDMDYQDEYLFVLKCLHEHNSHKSDNKGSREFRPVQKNAIKKAKELKRK